MSIEESMDFVDGKVYDDEDMFSYSYALDSAPVYRSVAVAVPSADDGAEHVGEDGFRFAKPVFRSTTQQQEKYSQHTEFDFWSLKTLPEDEDSQLELSFSKEEYSVNKISVSKSNVQLEAVTTTTTIQPKEKLTQAPIWVEKYYSVLSESDAETILPAASKYFNDKNINSNINGTTITGFCDNTTSTCNFSLSLYKWSDDQAASFGVEPLYSLSNKNHNNDVILIELSRQSGCAVSFAALYRDLIASLGPNIVKRNLVSLTQATNPTFSMPKKLDTCLNLNKQATEYLFKIASSEFSDMQLQGLAALATMSKCGENKKQLLDFATKLTNNTCTRQECPMVKLICDGLQSEDSEIRRYSASLVDSLSERFQLYNMTPNEQERVLASFTGCMEAILGSQCSKDIETKTVVSSAIQNVIQMCAPELDNHPSLKDSFEKMEQLLSH